MSTFVLQCPQCHATLTPPSKFARTTVCGYCGATVHIDPHAVSTRHFKEAFIRWNTPPKAAENAIWTIADTHWQVGPRVRGDDDVEVYLARRARWPGERALVEVARGPDDARLIEQTWRVLDTLQRSDDRGAANLTRRVPEPIVYGAIEGGDRAGAHALVLRRPLRHDHSLEDARSIHPAGIPPRTAIWLWRRILEVLSFVHRVGFVHGAVLPRHVLIERGEHGARLAGYTHASRAGAPARPLAPTAAGFRPPCKTLAPALDLVMSARCIAWSLGGDPEDGRVPPTVPGPLAALVRELARPDYDGEDAWVVRGRLGQIDRAAFGSPKFCPLPLPAAVAT